MNRPHHPTAWLWWTALVIALVASTVIYFVSGDITNLQADQIINTTIMLSVIGIGLCIISATAHWWTHR